MKQTLRRTPTFLSSLGDLFPHLSLAWILTLSAPAETLEQQAIYCSKHGHFLQDATMLDAQRYAPSRLVDILHVRLHVTPDFEARTVEGSTEITFQPISQKVEHLTLDAVDLDIRNITSNLRIDHWHVSDRQLFIYFEEPLATDQEVTLKIEHHAEPQKGMYFRTPSMGYKEGEAHLFTQGEPREARHWFPCFDAPNEKFTSEITCLLPEGMVALSNGRLIQSGPDAETKLTSFTWLQDKPHVNYLISLVAGPFVKMEDTYKEIPMAFWTLPSEKDQAIHSFRHTKAMMAFFEETIGVPYPWDKYDQVCVNDFVAGGMENTSLTSLTDRTLFTADTENLRSSQGLVAHELAHQWFGDLVTCKDWSHLWLNEGFATYYDALFEEHLHGRDAFLYQMYQNARGFIGKHSDATPMVDRTFTDPMQQFGYRAYPKGSWILHMLRSQLGDTLYHACIQAYLERYAYQNAVTENLSAIIEEKSGRSFDRFFDQYVYHGGHPSLGLRYQWDGKHRLAKISIQQKQSISEKVLLFDVAVKLRFRCGDQTVDHEIRVDQENEDFYVSLPQAPTQVRFDPDYTLLAHVDFQKPNPLWLAQLEDDSDMMGRLMAVEALKNQKSKAVLSALTKRLQEDPFHGVRIEAAKALGHMHTPDALSALLNSVQQADARVRLAVHSGISNYYHPSALESAKATLEEESNPLIIQQVIRAMADYGNEEIPSILLTQLEKPSYHNTIAENAIQAMRTQDNPVFIMPILEGLIQAEGQFTTRGLASALTTLGFLARHQEDRSIVRSFLAGKLNHPKKAIQTAAMRALEQLQDPRSIPILRNWVHGDPEDERFKAAQKAIASLDKQIEAPQALQRLRKQVESMEKDYRSLKERMETLQDQWDTMEASEDLDQSPQKEDVPES